MSEAQSTPAAAKPAPPARPAQPALPSQDDIAAWVGGAEVPEIGNLFAPLNLKTFDAKVMQVRKQELLPQHWQVIAARDVPPDEEFDTLPEVGRLRVAYADHELSRERLGALKAAWRELRGKRPALWTVLDLFAAMRRLYERGSEVDWSALLTASRDVWRQHKLPFGRVQLDHLWACLGFIREKTRG